MQCYGVYDYKQCDQIWRNFATLAIFLSYWQFCEGLFRIWQSFEHTLANFLMLLGICPF